MGLIAIIHKNKGLLGIAVITSTVLFIFLINTKPTREFIFPILWSNIHSKSEGVENIKIQEWWHLRKDIKNLSKLGEVLFLQTPEPKVLDIDKNYQILIWKYGRTIATNLSGTGIDPFSNCPVKNCNVTYNDSALQTADIVIIHLYRTKNVDDIPKPKQRNPNQIWAFLADESPFNTFLNRKNKFRDYNGIFNWSMTYRMDSDIPVPYGRTVLKKKSDSILPLNFMKRRDVLVAILGSNCNVQNNRWKYVAELQKYIQVDVYGKCGKDLKKACPGHFRTDCPAIDQYLFYLSFENSNCEEYITEKVWWNAYHKNSIPIVMGSSPESCKKLLPLDSYIHSEEFASPRALAEYILRLNQTEEYKLYYNWKKDFEVLYEHGFYQSKFYNCRICQALNYNTKDNKVYSDLEKYWSSDRDCHAAWDA